MLVQHYMKKSTEIVSNPQYMTLIEEHNKLLKTEGYIAEDDDSIRKRIYEKDPKSNGHHENKHEDERTLQKSNTIKEFEDIHPIENNENVESNLNHTNQNGNPFLKRLKNKSTYHSHKTIRLQENEFINSEMKKEIDSIELRKHKIEEQLNKEIDLQQENFNRLKKLRKTKTKKPPQQSTTPKGSANTTRRGSKYEKVVESLVLNQGVSQKEVLLDILEHSERQMKINQELMQKEIDDFISKSIKEMNDAIDELRLSYLEDLKEVDENVFPDLVNEMKSDMETDIEILRENYEELRFVETEKIRHKYMKKANN